MWTPVSDHCCVSVSAGDLFFHIEAAIYVGGAGPLHVSMEGETTQPFTPKPLPFITLQVSRNAQHCLSDADASIRHLLHTESRQKCPHITSSLMVRL